MIIINSLEEFTSWESPYKLDITSHDPTIWKHLQDMIDLGNTLSNTANITYIFEKIACIFQRDIALIHFSTGDKVLFYKSIGLGTGPESKDEWVPFPALTKDGWFIKRSRINKKDKYQVPIYQRIAKELQVVEATKQALHAWERDRKEPQTLKYDPADINGDILL